MANTRPKPKPRAASQASEGQQTVVRAARSEAEYDMSLLARAERMMGVKPITGRTRPRPGY